MAGFMKNAMQYLGMADVAEDDEPMDIQDEDPDSTTIIRSLRCPRLRHRRPTSAPSRESNPFQGRVSRITTIHPKSYEDAQLVGRAIRDGVPVVLNLTGVSEAVAYRIVDFSAGVVFGVRGSIERVTPRVFLLSPAQVNIKVEEPQAPSSAHDLFAD